MKANVCRTAPAEVRTFCQNVSESATNNLTLLKAIEQTVDGLALVQKHAKADTEYALKNFEHIKDCERANQIDTDGTICALFEKTESALDRFHQLLTSKRDAARKAPELEGDHKEAVVDEYTRTIAAIADLHNAMADLRWAIGEHDADLERPVGPPLASAEEVRAYLETL